MHPVHRSNVAPGTRARIAAAFPAVVVLILLALPGLSCRSNGPSSRSKLAAIQHPQTGQVRIQEGSLPVLTYQHGVISLDQEHLRKISPDNQKYAIPRADYLHPLFGPEGELLTHDGSIDHPHHRGIYWAWPEVDARGSRHDLHALQQLFAHPVGSVRSKVGSEGVAILASNVWIQGVPAHQPIPPGTRPILLETVCIRASPNHPSGRAIDLVFQFRALDQPVLLARRGTEHYGGLNLRFAPIREQTILTHNDPPSAENRARASWGQISGFFGEASHPVTVLILQHPANPDHPGDWVQYPNLNWLQPTFPAARTRYTVSPQQPLTLAYRLWIHPGRTFTEDEARELWNRFAETRPNQLLPTP